MLYLKVASFRLASILFFSFILQFTLPVRSSDNEDIFVSEEDVSLRSSATEILETLHNKACLIVEEAEAFDGEDEKSKSEQSLKYMEAHGVFEILALDYNYAPAQTVLGFLYSRGKGVDQDYEKAFSWYSKADVEGNGISLIH